MVTVVPELDRDTDMACQLFGHRGDVTTWHYKRWPEGLIEFASNGGSMHRVACSSIRDAYISDADYFAYDYHAMREQMAPIRTELLRVVMDPRNVIRLQGLCLLSM